MKKWITSTKTLLWIFIYAITIFHGNSQNHKKIDSLLGVIKKYEAKVKHSVKDTTYTKTLIELGYAYQYVNSDSLFSLAKQIFDISKVSDYDLGVMHAFTLYGYYYSDKGKSDAAIVNYQKALEIAKIEQDNYQKLDLLSSIAGDYEYLGNYSKALTGYLKVIDLATEIDDKISLSIINENIAGLYSSQKDYKQAMLYYEKVIAINDEIGDEIYAAETFSNIALTYSEMKRFDYAMLNVNKSITTFEKHQILNWLAFAYEVKGRIYLDQKKYRRSLYWFEQSNLIHAKIDDERNKIYVLSGISKSYMGLKKDSLALSYAEKAYKNAKNISSLEGQKECANTLYKIYKRNNAFTNALFYHELHKKLSDSLSRDDHKKSLSLLKAKLNYEKEKELLIEKTNKALAKQRVIIYSSLSILLILGIIIVLVVRSKNIQRKLIQELRCKKALIQKREIELSKINKTKNKLFSIIGHDLRGPVGALQELLRLFYNGDLKKEEFDSLIPKLKADVDNLLFTLNNLLSWGQSQMNGSSTKPKKITLNSVINRNIDLLLEIAHSKSIKIKNHVKDAPVVWADINQIDIVIRNLLSNAIKFTQDNGLITVSAVENSDTWQVQIKDSGVGMTKDMQKNIFSNYTNISAYGTNNEKGTGLGLLLCKEMIEKNNGKIWVDSTINKGSTFYFTIPKEKSSYKKAG